MVPTSLQNHTGKQAAEVFFDAADDDAAISVIIAAGGHFSASMGAKAQFSRGQESLQASLRLYDAFAGDYHSTAQISNSPLLAGAHCTLGDRNKDMEQRKMERACLYCMQVQCRKQSREVAKQSAFGKGS
jgi:hypothetical protein